MQINPILMSDPEILAELGARIRAKRQQAEMTQVELAKRVGVSKGTLVRLEASGVATLPTVIRVLRGLHALQNINSLVEDAPKSPQMLLKLAKSEHRKMRVRHAKPLPKDAP